MKREIRLNFYQVDKCGYYRRGQDVPEFGELHEMLEALHYWITDEKPLVRETQTFTPHEDSNNLPVYCYDIQYHSHSGDYLLTTWNELETTEGQIASVDAEGETGSARVTTSDLEKNALPGYPGYFWFVPSLELIACIRLDGQRLGGHPGMAQYINGYLERISPWTKLDRNGDKPLEFEIMGYSEGEHVQPGLKPRFRTSPVRLDGEISYIRKNRKRIRKIVRRDVYEGGTEKNPPLLRRMLHALGLSDDTQVLDDTRYHYELNFSPSKDELDEIINYWKKKTESHDTTQWDDIGFKFQSENEVFWLSRSTPKESLEVTVRMHEGVLLEGQSLMKALQGHRDSVLNRFRNPS